MPEPSQTRLREPKIKPTKPNVIKILRITRFI